MPAQENDSSPVDDRAALRLSVRNAATFWAAIARSRGHELLQRPGILAVVGDERAGMRILLLDPAPDDDARAMIGELITEHAGLPVVVEDQFTRTTFDHLGLVAKRMPVMVRDAATAPPLADGTLITVVAVESTEQLHAAEAIVVNAFDLPRMQPYQPGQAFPDDLLWYPGVRMFLAQREGQPVGACLTVDEGTCGGIYWVTSLPEHRSVGVGRAVMQAALAHLAPTPVSLTATPAGELLYASMGFRRVAEAAWWS